MRTKNLTRDVVVFFIIIAVATIFRNTADYVSTILNVSTSKYYKLSLIIFFGLLLGVAIAYKRYKKQSVDYFYPFLFFAISMFFLAAFVILK